MIIDDALQLLMRRGFEPITSNARDIRFLAKGIQKEDHDCVKICMVVRNMKGRKITAEQLQGLAADFERRLLLKGFREVEVMSLVFTDAPEQEQDLKSAQLQFWLIDLSSRRLIIYENQPEDYESMRSSLEALLQVQNIQHEEKRPRRPYFKKDLPYMTILLVAVNVIVYIAMLLLQQKNGQNVLMEAGADNWKQVFKEHEYYRLVTCMFLHFGADHLAGNMMMLLAAGMYVERLTGPLLFAIIYFVSGIGSSLFSSLYYMSQNQLVMAAGASGAIYGILGALCTLAFLAGAGLWRGQGRRMFLILLLIVFTEYNTSNVDIAAHLAGLLTGFVITYVLLKLISSMNQRKREI